MHLLKLPKDAPLKINCVYEKRGPGKTYNRIYHTKTLIHWAIGTYMKVLNTIFGFHCYMKVMTKAEGGDKVT